MKKLINNLVFLTIFLSLSASSCHKDENRYIYINNNFSSAIYYRFSFAYPDTTLQNSDPDNYKINAESKTFTTANVFAFNTTIQIFIFDADVIEKNPWDNIVKDYLVLKRYQLTESDMQKMDWTITYP